MLAIVQHEHELLRAKRVHDTLERDRTGSEIEAQGCRHGDRDKGGIGERRQVHEPHTV